jgi:uncharacterized membrane protein (DUF2068 family)
MSNRTGGRKTSAKRPPVLLAIVLYKALVACLLGITSIALLFAISNYQNLVDFSEIYRLEGKERIIDWLLNKLLKLNPRTLEYGGIAAGIYAILTTIEAIGLWYQKAWASILVVGLVGISIPFEVLELIRSPSILKFLILLINLAVLGYLIRFRRVS